MSWLLIAAMLVRGLVPVGFMPDMDGIGVMAIRICSSAGLQTIYIKTSPEEHPVTAAQHNQCALCAAPVLSGAVTQEALATFIGFLILATIAAGWILLTHRRFYVIASPRAPPSVS